jgi:uncharacterized membrane protein YkvI
MNRGPVNNIDDLKLSKSSIFSEIMHKNNRRMLKAFLTIMIIANISVTLIKITGKGSQYLTYTTIAYEIVIISVILIISELLIRKRTGTIFSGYVTLTSIFICLMIFQTAFSEHGTLCCKLYCSDPQYLLF